MPSYTWPEQLSCGQWQANDVFPAESSQTCEQYFFPSVQMQLQAECAHFLASAIGSLQPAVFRQRRAPPGCFGKCSQPDTKLRCPVRGLRACIYNR